MADNREPFDKGQSYDLAWAPPSYVGLNPDSNGYWSVLAGPSGTPIGVAWRDENDGTGFIPSSSGPMARSIQGHFTTAATLNVPASSAYELARSTPGVQVAEVGEGPLSSVYALLAAASPAQQDNDVVLSDDLGVNPYFITMDEEETTVLELVLSDDNGLFLRDNGQWVEVSEENDRVFDRIIVDVDPSIVEYFDEVASKNGNDALPVADFKKFQID